MRRIVPLLVIAIMLTNIVAISGMSPQGATISVGVQEAQAQAIVPLPPESSVYSFIWYVWGGSIIWYLSWVQAFYWALGWVISFWQDLTGGRPALGQDSATDDDALFFLGSTNCIIRGFGIFFKIMEANNHPISCSDSYCRNLWTTEAWNVCYDLQKVYGTQTGQLYCQDYLTVGSWKNPDSNGQSLAWRSYLDNQTESMEVNGQILKPLNRVCPQGLIL